MTLGLRLVLHRHHAAAGRGATARMKAVVVDQQAADEPVMWLRPARLAPVRVAAARRPRPGPGGPAAGGREAAEFADGGIDARRALRGRLRAGRSNLAAPASAGISDQRERLPRLAYPRLFASSLETLRAALRQHGADRLMFFGQNLAGLAAALPRLPALSRRLRQRGTDTAPATGCGASSWRLAATSGEPRPAALGAPGTGLAGDGAASDDDQ
jgi:hypothetical protein